jgi:hypothetical protein
MRYKKAKDDFIKRLIARNLFWSYSVNNAEIIPDELLIEQVLTFGEPEDIILLKKYYRSSEIKHVWQQHLLPDFRYKNANVWLAKAFFNIKKANEYIEKYTIKENRYDHLRLLASQN